MSKNFYQIQTLFNVANHHKEFCERLDCNVSLTTLKEIAESLTGYILKDEKEEVDKIFIRWPL